VSLHASLADRLFVGLLATLPQHGLSRALGWLTRRRNPRLVQTMIRAFAHAYEVDLSTAADSEPSAYPDFNAFFTRALRDDARPLDPTQGAVLSPVDAVVSQFGTIAGDTLVQAKGLHYNLDELLAGNEEHAAMFRDGTFATLYLAPRDYHRIHLPVAAHLRAMSYVPGRLFAVNQRTTRARARLFGRNERVICIFDAAATPFALVMVGAIGVGGIETVWSGPVTPAAVRRPRHYSATEFGDPGYAAGAEIGRFNMGSTVILLFPKGAIAWRDDLVEGAAVRMGERLASWRS
jgi:phosphatidylserine decarboxylase